MRRPSERDLAPQEKDKRARRHCPDRGDRTPSRPGKPHEPQTAAGCSDLLHGRGCGLDRVDRVADADHGQQHLRGRATAGDLDDRRHGHGSVLRQGRGKLFHVDHHGLDRHGDRGGSPEAPVRQVDDARRRSLCGHTPGEICREDAAFGARSARHDQPRSDEHLSRCADPSRCLGPSWCTRTPS